MQRINISEHYRGCYKPPTDIAANNSKLDPNRVEKSKRVREAKERLAQDKSWDALEQI